MTGCLLISGTVSLTMALLLSPMYARLARIIGIVDRPDGVRKFHRGPIPLTGGATILTSLVVAIAALAFMGKLELPQLTCALIGTLVLLITGLVDDRITLSSRAKLAGQFVSIAFVLAAQGPFSGMSFFGVTLDLGVFGQVFVAILLLSTINAFNLLDGADGFAATIGMATSIGLAGLAFLNGHLQEATFATALAGALAGFLVFNFPPAKVFLGDSGSMLVGLMVGYLTIRVGAPAGKPVPIGIILSLLALPFFDVSAAIVRRHLTRQPLARGDRGHLHHCLRRSGYGPRRMVAVALVFSSIPLIGVYASSVAGEWQHAWAGMATLGFLLIGTRSFGNNELTLLSSCIGHSRESGPDGLAGHTQFQIGLRESEDCRELWTALTDFAGQHGLSRVTMHLNGSWIDNGQDVLWETVSPGHSRHNWKAKLPVFAAGRRFGHIEISGSVHGSSGQDILGPLGELLESQVDRINRLFSEVARSAVVDQSGARHGVLFINRSYWPDCEATGQLLTDLCEDLGSHFDVSVLAGQPNHVTHEARYRVNGAQHRNNVDIYRVPHTTFRKGSMIGKAVNLITFSLLACWKVFWIPKHEVVVVETDPFLLALVGALVKRFRGSKLIVYLQDVYPDVGVEIGKLEANSIVTRTTAYLLRKSFRYADRVVVLGEDMRRRVISHGVRPDRIRLIPNWIDTSVVYPVKENNAFRSRFGLDDKFVVMHSGNMGLTQQLHHLIDVADDMRHRDDVVLAFVGGGASRSTLEGIVQERGLSNVRFIPYQPREELAISLSAADLHIVSMHPHIGGCLVPSKLYGIMASGTPVLAIVPPDTDVREIVRSERIGFAVNPGDLESIRATIECCADGDVNLEAMGTRSRELVERRFDRQRGTAEFCRLLKEYISQRRKILDWVSPAEPGVPVPKQSRERAGTQTGTKV